MVQRIKLAKENGCKFRDTMLEVQLMNLNVADLWTILEQKTVMPEEYQQVKEKYDNLLQDG